MRPTGTAVAAVLVLALGSGGCGGNPDYIKDQARRRGLEAAGVQQFDSANAYKLAGMSATTSIDIDVLGPGESRRYRSDPAFGLYHLRCGSCHEVPSPRSQPGFIWDAYVTRMVKNSEKAGLMPMSPKDEAEVRRFLRERAADAR